MVHSEHRLHYCYCCCLQYQKFSVGVRDSGLFSFFEVGGLETGDHGTHPDDVIQALKGHISISYQFRPGCPINEDNPYYISSQGLRDQIHCAVIVVSAEKLPYLTCGDKLKTIRTAASRLGIPQLVFMTNVDMVCGLTCKDLSKIYQSRRIKNRMKECSNLLGVPLNCIFPVKNYHQETCMDEKINCLMLDALTQIVHSANDYVEKCSRNQTHSE
ncbi:interferon-induced protein 44-like [Salminus brasiliensis]|uniref:interferon-induced protein 44-like n=1 Tax=Salminus brasiliensis TaxID=930266 RepID=UPI003B83216C